MKTNAVVVTAATINEAHRLAKSCAETAVQHAIECGRMLAAKKEELGRGNFDFWVERNCDFGRSSAYAYLKVADKSSRGLDDLRSIQQALGYDRPKPKPDTPKGAVSVVNPEPKGNGTEETGNDRPAASAVAPTPPCGAPPAGAASEPEIDDDIPELPDEAEMAAIERETFEAETRALRADDQLAGLHDELKRMAAELAVVKVSRDGFMRGKEEMSRLLTAEQRKTARLEKRIERLEAEAEDLRERIALMEQV